MTDSNRDEIAALRAQVARLAAQQDAGPNPARRPRTGVYAIVAVAAALVFGAAYFGSPLLSLHDLQRAARNGDRDRMDQLVDFPKVRENLKSKFDAYVLQSMRSDPNMANNPFVGLGALIVPALTDRAIDNYVTPDGIAAVVNNATPPKLNATDAAAPSPAASPVNFSPSFADLDHFNVALSRSDSPGAILTLTLERHGLFGWKLTRIDFNFPPTLETASPTVASTNAAIAPVAPPPSNTDVAESESVYAVAKVAAANFIIGHPDASDAQAVAAATAAAHRAGDKDAQSTGEYAASDARVWVATRKSNGFPAAATPAELATNDAAVDAAEQRECAKMSSKSGKSMCAAASVSEEPSRGAHYFPKIGTCFDTEVASIASRLENTPGSGDEVEYSDGHIQVSYDTSRVVQGFRLGDPIRLCVTDLPGHCPPADDRGIGFVAINGRTGGRWKAGDAEHGCGGA
ncbi:MAG TPA: DUF2939 domain-containing protein [Caulobacteraceae bacterium]|jgi:hypothetical protein|nr:DUF2939 domain-containing protein [Caulobacteraceae bacterium]